MRPLAPALLVLCTLVFPATLAAAESDPAYEFLGFASDGEHFLVKKHEGHEGWSVSLRSLHDDRQVRSLPLDDPNDERRLKGLARKYGLDKGVGPESPDGTVALLGLQDGKYFDILALEKPRIGRFKSLRLDNGQVGTQGAGRGLPQEGRVEPGRQVGRRRRDGAGRGRAGLRPRPRARFQVPEVQSEVVPGGVRMKRRRAPLPRHAPASSWKPWFQLAFLIFALAALLLMMTRIGNTSAGCFMMLTDEPAAETAAE